MEPKEEQRQFVSIARITAPHGIKGEVKAEILTDFPERFPHLTQVWMEINGVLTTFPVKSIRFHKGQVLLQFKELRKREQAEELRNAQILIPEEELKPLSKEQFYTFQLLDCEVVTTEGENLGQVTEVIQAPANDVLVVKKSPEEKAELLIPFLKKLFPEMNLEKKILTVLKDGSW